MAPEFARGRGRLDRPAHRVGRVRVLLTHRPGRVDDPRDAEGRRLLYYLAADATAPINRRELLETIWTTFGTEIVPEDDPTWRAVFRRMVPGRPPRECAYIYGVFGGTPRFLSAIRPGDGFEERIRTGEVEWSSRPVDIDVHFDLLRDLRDLAASGQGWAHAALDPRRSAGHIYFSAAGFTDHFRERADREGGVRLIDLEGMHGA